VAIRLPHGTLCFSTLGCGDLDLPGVLALAERWDIPSVELRSLGGTIDLPAHFEASFGTPERLTDFLRGQIVRIASVDTSAVLFDSGEDDRRTLRDIVPWARATNAKRLRVFDGGTTASEQELSSARPLLDWWQALATDQALPFTLAIETHDSLFDDRALEQFVDLYPHTEILWDTHHTWKRGGTDVATTWSRLADRTHHLHVKDSRADSSEQGYTYVAPGEGEFPFQQLIELLRNEDFDGTISLEWERFWHPELPDIEIALGGLRKVFG
jgi:sugar phosphate isomerase/epimerase